jgi:hypothetical protein
MPDPNNRPSLGKDIRSRYSTQKAGGAFDVKETLGQPETEVPAGNLLDAASAHGQSYKTKNGFETKLQRGDSRFKVVATGGKDGKSLNAVPVNGTTAGQIINATSANGQQFKSPNGFEVKVPTMESRMKVVQSNGNSGQSRHTRGLDTRRYGNRLST